MENIATKMPENDKQILKSVAPLVIVLILFFVVGKFGIAQIANVRNQITVSKKTQSTLSQKYNILRAVSPLAEQGSYVALIALPKSNPSLQVQSQIKSLVAKNAVAINSLKSSVSTSDIDSSYITTTVEINGPKESVLAFIKDIDSIAPITIVEKATLSDAGGALTAEISARTYFSPLPKTIPTITEPILDLTSSEKTLLTQIETLTKPTIPEATSASPSAINPNPFGQ